MTIKKSDLQALLDTLPDEFEPELFETRYALLSEEEVPDHNLQIALDRARLFRPEDGVSVDEYRKEARQWVADRS